MVEIHKVHDLTLGDGKIVKAHVCDWGYILMVPLCHESIRGRTKDPWRKARDTLHSLESMVQEQQSMPRGLTFAPAHGKIAMHRSLVQRFLESLYGSVAVEDDMRSMIASCESREKVDQSNTASTSDAGDPHENTNEGSSTPTDTESEAAAPIVSNPMGAAPIPSASMSASHSAFSLPDPRVTMYDGKQWVDAAREWKHIPTALQRRRLNWHSRLGALGISIAACRLTAPGDITRLVESGKGGTKSVFVPLSLWTTMRERLPSLAQGASVDSGSRDGDGDGDEIRQTIEHTLAPIGLAAGEGFYHDGIALRIDLYGERSVKGMFIDHSDLVKALGIAQVRDCPNVETFDAQTTDGRDLIVVDFKGMVMLWAAYAHKSSVASALMDWVTDTVFCVQYGTAEPMRQAEYEVMTLVDRSTRYRAADWGINGDTPSQGLYLDEVCSGEYAHGVWPEQVDAAMLALPDGTRLGEVCVVKIGLSTDKMTRTRDLRCDMRKAFGPEADLRIVAFSRCPGATEDELKPLETDILGEFDTYRLRGVSSAPGSSEMSELFLVTRAIARDISAALSVAAGRFARAKMHGLESDLDTSVREMQERARVAEFELERAQARIEAIETLSRERIDHRNSRIDAYASEVASKDAALAAKDVAIASKDAEINALRRAITKTLPSDLSDLLADVLCVH